MAQDMDALSFSIEDTIDYGNRKDATLLNDFLADDSVNPEDIQKIKKETSVEIPKKEDIKEDKEKEEKKENLLKNFLDDEEEEENEEVVTKKPIKEEEEISTEESQFSALSKDLLKLGVFTEEEGDEPIETPEQFLEKFNSEKKKGAIEMVNSFIGQFGEDYQKAFEAIFVKGANPKEYFSTYNTIVDFAELDLTKEINQEKVLRESLMNQDWDATEVDEEIERLKNIGDLELVAKRHHKGLVKKQAQKLQEVEQQAEQNLQLKRQAKQQYITTVQNIVQEKLKNKDFDGIPLNPQLATELQDFLLKDKWETPQGEQLTDFDKFLYDLKKPENSTQRIKIALIAKILDKDPTLSTIQKAGISKKSDKLFESVTKVVKKEATKEAPKSWF